LLLVVICLLLLAIPITALANKQVWKARLTTGAELHPVVDSQASGAAVFATNPDGSLHFMLQVRGLSGPVVGAHIHGPATEAENAPVAVTLCGNPAPAAVAECSVTDGTLTVEGDLTSSLLAQWGLRGATLFEWLNTGMSYVNVHTPTNPAGETRGQIYPR
jgi:hypothetical protein